MEAILAVGVISILAAEVLAEAALAVLVEAAALAAAVLVEAGRRTYLQKFWEYEKYNFLLIFGYWIIGF